MEEVLTECRMVLPGAQALLGFQLAIVLMEAFDRLPVSPGTCISPVSAPSR